MERWLGQQQTQAITSLELELFEISAIYLHCRHEQIVIAESFGRAESSTDIFGGKY